MGVSGGKVEADEELKTALVRELEEELGISPTDISPLIEIQHDYTDKSVFLDVWWVTAFSGSPEGREGQATQWVPVESLNNYEFPEANKPIINAIETALDLKPIG